LLEIAQQAAREGLESLLTNPPPIVRLIPGFGPSSLDFSLIVQVREFRDQFLAQSELRKRILARFAQEDITMPFPTQSIFIEKTVPGS
jgi:small-conductance mechanosensitive channel